MSAPVLSFTPRAELGAAANLNEFIALCRQSDVLGARSQFDKNVWDIGHFKGQNKQNRVVFSTLEASDQNKSVPAFPTQFLDFAKAAIVYLHDKQPVVSQSPRVGALRCLEAALRESGKGSSNMRRTLWNCWLRIRRWTLFSAPSGCGTTVSRWRSATCRSLCGSASLVRPPSSRGIQFWLASSTKSCTTLPAGAWIFGLRCITTMAPGQRHSGPSWFGLIPTSESASRRSRTI
ncbi:hypothetical protein R77569_02422 [Ralstonia mannitolilytica]|uniref:Uncharacterized protein n=1 Tax=Ralstonia mannitolilytica TaxID=105219 RepID=A0ABN9K955_9RALS|nr:hypothetical protein R77569_02422 [Ralstonia mannitolilytica]